MTINIIAGASKNFEYIAGFLESNFKKMNMEGFMYKKDFFLKKQSGTTLLKKDYSGKEKKDETGFLILGSCLARKEVFSVLTCETFKITATVRNTYCKDFFSPFHSGI